MCSTQLVEAADERGCTPMFGAAHRGASAVPDPRLMRSLAIYPGGARFSWWTQSSQIGQVLHHGRDGHATGLSWHGRLAREDSGCSLSKPGAHLKLKMTVTVAVTGTGSPLSNVGEYFHCLNARPASSTSSG